MHKHFTSKRSTSLCNIHWWVDIYGMVVCYQMFSSFTLHFSCGFCIAIVSCMSVLNLGSWKKQKKYGFASEICQNRKREIIGASEEVHVQKEGQWRKKRMQGIVLDTEEVPKMCMKVVIPLSMNTSEHWTEKEADKSNDLLLTSQVERVNNMMVMVSVLIVMMRNN